jgi:pimeloyl-ACP methyl ester carboxylesterase
MAESLVAAGTSKNRSPYGEVGKEWPFQSRFVDVRGNRIHYIDEGRGPILLFVHVGMWSFVWRDVITRLRADFRCVALDFPATGYSRPSKTHRNTLLANAGVLEAFIEQLHLDNITLVVHDLGGPVGLSVAARHSELFSALVITQAFGWPLRDYKWVRRMLRFMSGPTMARLNRKRNVVARLTSGRLGVGRHLSEDGRKAFLAPFDDPSTRVAWTQLIGDALRIDEVMADVEQVLTTKLHSLPVLTIFGERNDPFDWQGRYDRSFAETRPIVITNGNHFPAMDDPELFATALREWWNDVVEK